MKTIFRKELQTYFTAPTAYIILTVFLVLWEYLFFRDALLVGEASLRGLFSLLPWLLVVLIPALTMDTFAKERQQGTLELLLTHPVSELEAILGKFWANLGFITLGFLAVLPLATSFNFFGAVDFGVVLGQFLAAVLSAAVLISLGIFISGLFKNQISALLVTVVAAFVLIILGFELVTSSLPLTVVPIVEQLSLLTHFNSIARGVIDMRDLWYFLSATAVFLTLAHLTLVRRRLGNRQKAFAGYRNVAGLIVVVAVLTNIVGQRFPGRIDLTRNNLYTLSDQTTELLKNLDQELTVTLYASPKLPARLQPTLRETKDILGDYDRLGGDQVKYQIKDPTSTEIAQEAMQKGIREVQFNIVGQGEFQSKTGFLGISVEKSASNQEDSVTKAIPFVQDPTGLEYQLTSLINQLTKKDKRVVGFLTGVGGKSLSGDYQAFNRELSKQFETRTVETNQLSQIDVLVIAGPTKQVDATTREAVKGYLRDGKPVFFLEDGVTVSPQVMGAVKNEAGFKDVLSDYGINVQPNLVYDLAANETITFGRGVFNLSLPYPFWVRAQLADGNHPVTEGINEVTIPWGSEIKKSEDLNVEAADKITVTTLLQTTKSGGAQAENFTLQPEASLSQENLGQKTLAVAVGRDKQPLMVVTGDSEFLENQFIQNNPQNLALGIEAISWLAGEESLAGIAAKQQVNRNLVFTSRQQADYLKFGNLALVGLVPLAVGAVVLYRRKNLVQ